MIVLNELGTPQLNTVHHCRAEALLSALDSNSIDLAVTSPPYDQLRSYNGFSWNFEYIAQQTYRVLKPGGVLVWVVGDAVMDGSESLTSMKQAIHFVECAGFRLHDTMIYSKAGVSFPETVRYYQQWEYMFVLSKGKPTTINLQMKRNRWGGTSSWGDVTKRDTGSNLVNKGVKKVNEYGVMGNVWDFHAGAGFGQTDDVYEHPATFPELLAERHIMTWSDPGQIVMDFFGGSGTVAKMARLNGRNYLTCDISREYCDLMERRLAQPYTPSFMPQLESA